MQKLTNASANRIDSCEKDWNRVPLKELTDHIVEAYHVPLRTELARLQKLINKVASVHGKAHPAVIQIESTFRSFKEDIELHSQKEEMILFPGTPRLRQASFGCGGSVDHRLT